ncbi:MAG: hypothetical protein LBP55_10365 [Candidatus Adiutrix sp.]|nr:hypothetical protein [Candidatus Adiutrix sp.]
MAADPGFAALPKDHAAYLKTSEDYQSAFEQFTKVMQEAKERLSAEDYNALEGENETAIAESVREDMASDAAEVDAYATAFGMRNAYVNQALTWDWLRQNAVGVQGFYRLKSGAFDGYLTVQEGEDKGVYAVYIFAAQKEGGAENNGELRAEGKLDVSKIRLNYGNDDPSATIDLTFDGETAQVATSEAFKKSGWFGANVLIDGDYLREKK